MVQGQMGQKHKLIETPSQWKKLGMVACACDPSYKGKQTNKKLDHGPGSPGKSEILSQK
jgi:hypothetical protein